MLNDLLALAALLFFSAFFSSSETILLSLDSIKIKRIQKNTLRSSYLLKLLADPSRFLATILIGNIIVNIALSSIITSILIKAYGDKGLAIAIGAATFLLLVFGELIPKVIGIKRAEEFAVSIARPLEVFARAIHPLRRAFSSLADFFIRSVGIRLEKQQPLTHDELKSIIELSHKHGVVKENEKEMIRSVLELTQATVQEIMTPRPDINAISESLTREQAVEYLIKSKHSKIPVYKGAIDNVVGILNAKDMFLFPDKGVQDLMKPAIFVPETKKIAELLKKFQEQNAKIAIVVDEYGNTYGLATLEDVLEEIVGEIYDEFETQEEFIERLDAGSYRVSAKAPVDLINEELELNIPLGDYETIAGYLLFLFRKIPQEGECLKKDKLSFCVEKLAGKRIKSVLIKKI